MQVQIQLLAKSITSAIKEISDKGSRETSTELCAPLSRWQWEHSLYLSQMLMCQVLPITSGHTEEERQQEGKTTVLVYLTYTHI